LPQPTLRKEALRGHARTTGDGLIRVFDLFNYVAEHVAETAPGRQHPIFKAADLEDNFPVALERGGTKSASAGAVPEDRWRELEQLLADLYPAGPTEQEIWVHFRPIVISNADRTLGITPGLGGFGRRPNR
jgi:hypothetical protein